MSSKKDSFPVTAERLQYALDRKGWSASMLVGATGISKSSISQYLHGYHAPTNIKAQIIGKALDVNPMWLMGFDAPMQMDALDYSVKDKDGYEYIIEAYKNTTEERRRIVMEILGLNSDDLKRDF